MNNVWLAHHGILGQKWGVRRYQNKDGSLTNAGKKRYLNADGRLNKKGIHKAYGNYNDPLSKTLRDLEYEKDHPNKKDDGPSKEEIEKYKKKFPEMFKGVNEDDPEELLLAVDDAKRYNKDISKKNSVETYRENATKAADSLSRLVKKNHNKTSELLKEWKNIANSGNEDLIKSANEKMRKHNEEEKQSYRDFIRNFEKENGVSVKFFQPLIGSVCFTFTDGDKIYQVYKGSHFSGISDVTEGYNFPDTVSSFFDDDHKH